jgi:hypothetical protein
MVTVFSDLVDELLGKLTAAGLPATADPTAGVPFVLVDLLTVTAAVGVGAWAVTVPVRCVVPPPGDVAARQALEQAVETVLVTLGAARAEPGTYRQGDKDLPAYTITYPLQVPNPNC